MAQATMPTDKRLRKRPFLTADTLRTLVHYNPETGIFTWLPRTSFAMYGGGWNKKWAGKRAGTRRPDGYWTIGIYNRANLAHRLAWLYMTGHWPEQIIDHVNGVRGDDRFSNLREATNAENLFNSVLQPNFSGVRGVSLHKRSGMWHASIQIDGRVISLGYHHSIELAGVAYRTAARLLRGKWIRTDRDSKISNNIKRLR